MIINPKVALAEMYTAAKSCKVHGITPRTRLALTLNTEPVVIRAADYRDSLIVFGDDEAVTLSTEPGRVIMSCGGLRQSFKLADLDANKPAIWMNYSARAAVQPVKVAPVVKVALELPKVAQKAAERQPARCNAIVAPVKATPKPVYIAVKVAPEPEPVKVAPLVRRARRTSPDGLIDHAYYRSRQ